jgi:hypothetical protein
MTTKRKKTAAEAPVEQNSAGTPTISIPVAQFTGKVSVASIMQGKANALAAETHIYSDAPDAVAYREQVRTNAVAKAKDNLETVKLTAKFDAEAQQVKEKAKAEVELALTPSEAALLQKAAQSRSDRKAITAEADGASIPSTDAPADQLPA